MIWKTIKTVHEHFRGISERLAELTGTSAEWWRSHARPTPTFNEQNGGKDWSPVKKYLEGIDLYEQADKGAGVMLSEQINQFVRCRYTNCETANQNELVNTMLKETTEGIVKANAKPFEQMTTLELEDARKEVAEAMEASKRALDVLDRMIVKRREVFTSTFTNLATGGASMRGK